MHIIQSHWQPFFDLFYIGEGETVYDALFDAYKANKEAGGSREEFLMKGSSDSGNLCSGIL